ncbi:MAG: hypothetical protein NVSMB29_20300 [Candidatus Dormibacteria bacterium]
MVSRPHSALRLGHVAWGYTRLIDGRPAYTFGGVEDSRGLPVAPPTQMEFWQESAPAGSLEGLVTRLERLGYRQYKSWAVDHPDPAAADAAAARQGSRTYLVVGNNCLDSVHLILTAYGATDFHLLDPRHPRSWIPNSWFASIPEPIRPLETLRASAAFAR